MLDKKQKLKFHNLLLRGYPCRWASELVGADYQDCYYYAKSIGWDSSWVRLHRNNASKRKKKRPELTPEQKETIRRILTAGHTLQKAIESVDGPSLSQVRSYAKSIGWDVSWRKQEVFTIERESSLNISIKEILERYDNDETQASIAIDAGCTREYIRQIILKNGRKPSRAKVRDRKRKNARFIPLINLLKVHIEHTKIEEKKRKREEDDHNRFYEAHLMYLDGAALKKIADHLKMDKNSTSWWIGRLRLRYGWFLPKRRNLGGEPEHRQLKSQRVARAVWVTAEPHWPCSHQKISDITGIKVTKISQIIAYARDYNSDWFPTVIG